MLTLSDNDYTRDYEAILTLRDVHEAYGLDLGLRDYPIFDEGYRTVLNQRIYDHFAYRRIASDTPQLFVFYLNRRMRENMPTFNALYRQVLDKAFDPFATYVSDSDGNDRGASDTVSKNGIVTTGSTTSDNDSVNTSTVSDTPASYLTDPTEIRYMSQLNQAKGTTTGKGTSNGTQDTNTTSNNKTASDYIAHVKSRAGYFGDNVANALASGFLNTDLLVCDMLEPCFMQVWTDEPF